ncbi:sensor histidine kinase [Glycomyces algeriensis]|uniref:histidine kinase n=1 Tax=Glycomyces algeriensis TaxID=256037 RepID=A0A9W6LGF7_9ACTN|nr:sensor histidine kinase [Glycomyces algeriensis]MDA1365081.1 sensor histidine kinase [Glycomyces algeriensis]MDR7349857.1 signal transduction histidine kinase [Glycomyces algeriensis]GLI42568.1 two-component sensor histidine kinase [Glycomyces algeriensis]
MTSPPAARTRLPALAFDIGLAVLLGVLTSGTTIGATADHHPGPLAFVLIGATAAFLAVRRHWPEIALAGSLAGLYAYLYLGLPEGPIYMLPAFAVFFYAFARPLKTVLTVLAVLFVVNTAFQTFAINDIPDLWVNASITFVWLGIAAAGGRIVREARHARAREREAERERYRADERVEMAREIHDVVGHSLAVVSMNAGVALHVLEKHRLQKRGRGEGAAVPPEVVENLQAIRDASTRALQDLRATLAPLRQGRQPDLRPTGAIADIPSLVDSVRTGGLQVEYTVAGEPGLVPTNIAATAYRVVQESLTNVIRHAEATKATVRIDCGPTHIRILVEDDGRGGPVAPDRIGQGVTGMTERVETSGGTFSAAPARGGGFAVEADMPYTRSAD